MAEIDRLHENGYFGPAAGAAEAIGRQVDGADIAVVRIVSGQAGIESMRAVLGACRPVPDSGGQGAGITPE